MRILLLNLIFCVFVFASAKDSLDDMDKLIKELDELHTQQNERLNEAIALNKDKSLSNDYIIFLFSQQNELLLNTLKIKGQQ